VYDVYHDDGTGEAQLGGDVYHDDYTGEAQEAADSPHQDHNPDYFEPFTYEPDLPGDDESVRDDDVIIQGVNFGPPDEDEDEIQINRARLRDRMVSAREARQNHRTQRQRNLQLAREARAQLRRTREANGYNLRTAQGEQTAMGTEVGGHNLRHRRPGRYVGGILREERVEVGLHITAKKALNKFKHKALVEMYREIMQVEAKKVWHPRAIESLTRKQLKKIIRSSLFFKEKFNSIGEFEKLKARLVAGGHMQDKSLYEDISSPTVSTAATFITAAIAAQEGRDVATLDIGGAYLTRA
jgi:hypothetical protein